MAFTLEFIRVFGLGLLYATPLLLFLMLLIVLLGLRVGRLEGWSRLDALYYAFITATTVGYGDYRPASRRGKIFAIVIALIGLIMTGIMVAIAVKAATVAFGHMYNLPLPG